MKDAAAPRPKRPEPPEPPRRRWFPGRSATPPAPPPTSPVPRPATGPVPKQLAPPTPPAPWPPAAPSPQPLPPEEPAQSSAEMLFGTAPQPTAAVESDPVEPPATERERRPAHYAAEPLPDRARRFAVSTATILGMLVVVLASATGLAALLLPDDDTTDQTAADDVGSDLPDNEWKPSGTSTSASSSSTTTSTTGSVTSTTARPDVVGPVTTTSRPRSTTTRPTTTTSPATTTTTAPDPVINSFDADVLGRGCGQNASPVDISWSTTHATSVTLGRVPGGQSGVPADGQLPDVCVSDSGETWRLTASGPGGTTSRDISINP